MYREVASHYDKIYRSKDYAAESGFVRKVILKHSPGARTLLDVACGTGVHLQHLQASFDCEGLDLSPEMIKIATDRLPGTPLHVADMTEFHLDRHFDAIVCLFSSVGHLVTTDRLKAAISNMARHLNADGVLLIEPWIDPARWVVGQVGLDTYEDEEIKLARLSVSEPVDRGRMVMDWLVGTRFGVQRLREEHEMGWFTHTEYVAAFTDAGLRVDHDPSGPAARGLYVAHRA